MDNIVIPIESNLTTPPVEVGSFVSQVVGLVLSIAAVITFVYLVWGGIEWITGGGDKGKIESARNRITGAIIGLAIVALSWAIYLILDNFFGIGVAGKTSSSYSSESSSSDSSDSSGSTAGIGFNCVPTTRCDTYCTNSDYYTVRNPAVTCGSNTIGCACVNKSNPKVNPCPAGLTCN